MTSSTLYLRLSTFLAVMTLVALSAVSSGSALHKILKKREVVDEVKPVAAVAVPPSKAKQFLAPPRRPKRNIWDRSRPDVQQWIQQFMYMGYDEARLEADLSYWMDHARSSDQARQHHYDENSPIGPRYPGSYRHGADVNYDYY
ncbi:hypothetical protein P4O66_007940 [Electrophorus voltai]|uniref:ECRG4 augurin precursor n=2 Tax=Electrophorus TaxID=8004 RepID=A0AAY5F180_ELEEL|nr:augurin-A [Electrophorus electricus]KAK1797739.1 hypothetical protein P4O66_007940 [Electrophorus voltai]